MSPTQNPGLDPDMLSPNAKKMFELRDEVLLEWGKRLRATVKEAEHLPHPILINTFPMLYENLVEAITPNFPRRTGEEGSTVASEHGGERARLTDYKPQAVISEYQLLRWTILDVLKRHGVQLNNDEFFIINASIDDAIRESVNAFALTQAALRERFVVALTHDLRNPLATANAAAELIRHTTDSSKTKELTHRIITNLARMDAMIQELLDAVVFQNGERLRLHIEEFNITEVVREVCDQFASIHGPRFQMIGDEPIIGYWDRTAIKRALENLVGNAVKYGATETPIQVKVVSYHERVMLTVHNEGQPIPPEHLEYVFQIFQRATSAKEGRQRGWGIGLPYVRSVAESHGGSVSVDSATERGTSFSIDMPLDSRPFQHAPTLAGR